MLSPGGNRLSKWGSRTKWKTNCLLKFSMENGLLNWWKGVWVFPLFSECDRGLWWVSGWVNGRMEKGKVEAAQLRKRKMKWRNIISHTRQQYKIKTYSHLRNQNRSITFYLSCLEYENKWKISIRKLSQFICKHTNCT